MRDSTVGFRTATHDDADFAVAVGNAVDPTHPQVAGELLEKWVNTEKGSGVRRFIVQENGRDRGWISLVQPHEVGGLATYLNLLLPAADKHLLPAAVTYGETQARLMGAPLLMCEVGEDQDHTIEFLRGAGWTQERRQRYWRLDLGANAERIRDLRAVAMGAVEAAGVAIETVAELGGEVYLPRLLPVAHATAADIPSSVDYVPEPFEEWVVWMQPPSVLPERVWVAVSEGEPVGYSYLAYRVSIVETGYTGVIREHRGKGLARALKLATLEQALELGATAVETDNDSENAPILHLNEELGYREIPGKLEFHRALD